MDYQRSLNSPLSDVQRSFQLHPPLETNFRSQAIKHRHQKHFCSASFITLQIYASSQEWGVRKRARAMIKLFLSLNSGIVQAYLLIEIVPWEDISSSLTQWKHISAEFLDVVQRFECSHLEHADRKISDSSILGANVSWKRTMVDDKYVHICMFYFYRHEWIYCV